MQTVPCCVVLGKSLLEKCPFSHGNQNRSPPDTSVFRYWHTFAKAMPESKLLLVDISETNTVLLWHYRPKVSRPLIARTERRIPLERDRESERERERERGEREKKMTVICIFFCNPIISVYCFSIFQLIYLLFY